MFIRSCVDVVLQGCNAVWLCRSIQTFRSNILLSYSYSLKMQAVCTSETLVSTNTSTRRYNPEDQHRHLHRRENLESHIRSCVRVFSPLNYINISEDLLHKFDKRNHAPAFKHLTLCVSIIINRGLYTSLQYSLALLKYQWIFFIWSLFWFIRGMKFGLPL
jgi:hypothetical protein